MKYRLIDMTNCRDLTIFTGDKIFESELDIHEVAKSLLIERFQEMYDSWKATGENEDFSPGHEEFLQGTTEFYETVEISSTFWAINNGEESSRLLVLESDPDFYETLPLDVWKQEPHSQLLLQYWEAYSGFPSPTVVDSFETLTGTNPYGSGLWEKGFSPEKALLDAGIIKEVVA